MTARKLPEITEVAISRDLNAKAAFEKLICEGVPKDELLSLLARIPYASKTPEPLVRGMTNGQVRAITKRIRNFADQIAKINESPWIGPERWRSHSYMPRSNEIYPTTLRAIASPRELRDLAVDQFLSVPQCLVSYANFLSDMLRFFCPTGDTRKAIGYQPLRPQKWLTMELLQLVRRSTRAPYFSHVATLLNQAYDIANGGKDRRQISEGDLSKLERNNPWFAYLSDLMHSSQTTERNPREES